MASKKENKMSSNKHIIKELKKSSDDTLMRLWDMISKNGLEKIDSDILQAFYEEFKKRPGVIKTSNQKETLMPNNKQELAKIPLEPVPKLAPIKSTSWSI